jgi:hypothetical protein
MRAFSLIRKEPVTEVSMRPQDFGKALEQGADDGMLIGFEFETYVKRANLSAEDEQVSWNAKFEKLSLGEVYDIVETWVDDMIATSENIDDIDSVLMFNPAYPQLTYKQAFETPVSFFVDMVKKAYAKLPEDKRIKVKKAAYREAGTKNLTELQFATEVASVLDQGLLYRILSSFAQDESYDPLRPLTILNDILTLLSKSIVGKKVSEALKVKDWDTAIKTFPDLQRSIDELGYFSSISDSYSGVAKALQPVLSNAVGKKVHVFGEYHERNKNSTDWYIEPDGSLGTKIEGGSGVEIVTPPLNARAAMEALKQFYALAKQYDFMTDKTTGLHINMSIPKTLDPMKLVLFLGDQHVLKSFGRENSDYAESVLRKLKGESYRYNAVDIKTKKGKSVSNLLFKELQATAREVMDDHTVSISGENKKYFSFRHAGGDYLADMNKVINTVGRFARAMLIASDPNAYREEYIKKLTQLISPSAPTPYSIRQSEKEENYTDLQQARTNLVKLYQTVNASGLPVKQYWAISDTAINKTLSQLGASRDLRGINWSQADRNAMLNVAQKLKQVAQENPDNWSVRNTAHRVTDLLSRDYYPSYAIGTPNPLLDLSWIKVVNKSPYAFAEQLENITHRLNKPNYQYRDYGGRDTIYVGEMYSSTLPANHPYVVSIFKTLVAEYNQIKAAVDAQNKAEAEKQRKRANR